MTLKELRQRMQVSQGEVAERLGIAQANVSVMERRGQTKLETLQIETVRRFVEALGGRLELLVVMGDRQDERYLLTPAGRPHPAAES